MGTREKRVKIGGGRRGRRQEMYPVCTYVDSSLPARFES